MPEMNPHPIISLRPGVVVTHHVAKPMPVSRNYVTWVTNVVINDWMVFHSPLNTWRQWEIGDP